MIGAAERTVFLMDYSQLCLHDDDIPMKVPKYRPDHIHSRNIQERSGG